MAKFNYLVPNFLGGEVSPKFRARADLEQYRTSCDLIVNGIPQKSGGISKRNGTAYETYEGEFTTVVPTTTWLNAESTDADKGFRQFPFKATNGDKYCIIMGVKETASTNTFPIRILKAGGSPADFDFEYPPDTLVTGQTQYDLHGLFSGFTSVQQLQEAQYQQVNDVLVIVHDERPPCYIIKTGDDTFALRWARDLVGAASNLDAPGSATITEAKLFCSMPFRDPLAYNNSINQTAPGMTLGSATLGAQTTMTTNPNSAAGAYFVSDHVGSFFKVTDSGQTGLVLVTGYTSANQVDVTVVISPGGTSIDAGSWQESAWSPYRGYPRCVTYHEGRLIFGGREGQVWASEIGDIAEFTSPSTVTVPGQTGWTGAGGGSTSSDAFSNSIDSDFASAVNWLTSGDTLGIGSENREYTASLVAGSSATTLSVDAQTSFGSAYVQAKRVGNVIIFVDKTGRNIREFVFNFSDDNYRSEDISFKATHMVEYAANMEEFVETGRASSVTLSGHTDPQVKQLQVQNTSDGVIVWMIDNFFGMFGFNRDRDLGVNAWFQYSSGETQAIDDIHTSQRIKNLTMCALESADGRSDDLWLMTQRTINGGTEFLVERATAEFTPYQSIRPLREDVEKQGVHLDCMILDTSSGTTVTVGTEFEGESLSVVGDGVYLGEFTVDGSGNITLNDSVETAIVGYNFDMIVQPVRIEAGSVYGNSQGTIQSIEEIVFRLYRTKGLKVGIVDNPDTIYISSGGTPYNAIIDFDYSRVDFDSLNFRPGNLPLNLKVPYFNGDYSYKVEGGFSDNGRIIIKSDEPYPVHLLGLIVKGSTYDR